MTDPGECVCATIELVRARDKIFVGTLMVLGVGDLPFVDPSTNVLAIEKRRTENALFVRITRGDAP